MGAGAHLPLAGQESYSGQEAVAGLDSHPPRSYVAGASLRCDVEDSLALGMFQVRQARTGGEGGREYSQI